MHKLLVLVLFLGQFYCAESRYIRKFQEKKITHYTFATKLVDFQPIFRLQVRLPGQKKKKVLNFILDTGSNVSILNASTFPGKYPKKILKVKSFLKERKEEYSLVRLNLFQENKLLLARALFYTTKFHSRLNFDGIIGNNILSRFKIFLELPERVTFIRKNSKLDFISTQFDGSIIEYNRSHIILPAYLGSKPLFFIFDTGAGISFLNPENIRGLESYKIGEKSFYDLSGEFNQASAYDLPNFCLVKENLCEKRMEFVAGKSIRNFLGKYPVDGLLGINLINRYYILIDYDKKVMYFNRKDNQIP
ncbi:MAG: hypothetical protein AAF518_07400 [Spirochaetota bacterium]